MIADSMGLGKTKLMIAAIMALTEDRKSKNTTDPQQPTLVMVPSVLLVQTVEDLQDGLGPLRQGDTPFKIMIAHNQAQKQP